MNKQNQVSLKTIMLGMQETQTQITKLRKLSPSKLENFTYYRQQLHLKIMSNTQVQINEKYILYELIESTIHFDLYRAIQLKTKCKMLIKLIDKSTIRKSLTENELIKDRDQQFNEFELKLKTQFCLSKKLYNGSSRLFLVGTWNVFEDQNYLAMVTQNYCEESLETILKRRISLTIQQALAILKQIIFALAEYHKEGVILSELNPAFIYHKNGIYKLCDLSSMRKVSQKFSSLLNINYAYTYEDIIAPELLVCPQVVDIKSEIWALGILFYHMIAHNVPYQQRGIDIVEQAKNHHIWFQLKTGPASEEVKSFLKEMVATDPTQRMSWKKLINHPIFENFDYFSTVKLSPIVDIRNKSLKKRQNDIIPEELLDENYQKRQNYDKFLKRINLIEWKELFKDVQKDKINAQKILDIEDETFFYIKKANLMALKASYIFTQILEKVHNYKLIDTKRRSHIQTIYLIAQRCCRYISRAKNNQGGHSDNRIDNYQEQLKDLHSKISQFTNMYEKKLSRLQTSTFYISKDLFGSMISKKNKERYRIVKGRQGKDFTIEEHVHLTQQNWIDNILPQMKGQSLMLEYVIPNMQCYEAINNITLEDIEGSLSFSEIVGNIIDQRTAKINKKKK